MYIFPVLDITNPFSRTDAFFIAHNLFTETKNIVNDICSGIAFSPGLLDNNPEQIPNKLKISAYVLETT